MPQEHPNGAELLVSTLASGGIEVCFANPGTSEMHFVSALDRVAGIRCVPCLFEGGATGAADGYYRMADRPASTLLHLGPGLANGLANLHNAKKAGSGIVNIVGQHALSHIALNAPLTADIEAIARPMSHWVETVPDASAIVRMAADAISAARMPPGRIATLILPANTAWDRVERETLPVPVQNFANGLRAQVTDTAVEAAGMALRRGCKSAILVGGAAGRADVLEMAGRIAAHTGCRLLSEYNLARLQRGAGRVITERIPYNIEAAVKMLKDVEELVLVGARAPVAFFAYPGKPGVLAPDACRVTNLAGVEADIAEAMSRLAKEVGAQASRPAYMAKLDRPALPMGRLTLEGIGATLAALLPEQAVVIDESVTTGRGFALPTDSAAPHDWLNIVGGAIGFGLPAATGAAIGAPGRTVIVLQGDGSAMYTVQSLWTMAREALEVKVLLFANRSYRILRGELDNVGAPSVGPRAEAMLSLGQPPLDWVALAKGHGVPASRVEDLSALATAFSRAIATPGPCLIEVAL